MRAGTQVQGVTLTIVLNCRADGALRGVAGESEEQHQCQQAGSVVQAVAADWKHPSVLLLIELASWDSKEESSCELRFLNAVLLLTKRTLPDDATIFSNAKQTHKHASQRNRISIEKPLTVPMFLSPMN
jgi:hypothetical protein